MDEDAIKTQQMLDQVSTMVKENPDWRCRAGEAVVEIEVRKGSG